MQVSIAGFIVIVFLYRERSAKNFQSAKSTLIYEEADVNFNQSSLTVRTEWEQDSKPPKSYEAAGVSFNENFALIIKQDWKNFLLYSLVLNSTDILIFILFLEFKKTS